MDQTKSYTQEELESFAKGIKKVADIIRMNKPDFIFAPIIGAVPFVDMLSIMDRHFPLESVDYPPNSSRFLNRTELLNKWYCNFLNENYTGEPLKIVCLDEVLSGSSASAGYYQFKRAIEIMALDKAAKAGGNSDLMEGYKRELEKKIEYLILGIGEKRERNHNFSKLVNQKIAYVVDVDSVITLDNLLLNPLRLKTGELNAQGRQSYLPEIEKFETSPEYLTLLQDIARYTGADPSRISPINLGKINESLARYLK